MNWDVMVGKLWKAFYANVRTKGWKRLGKNRRLQLLTRSTTGVANYFCSVMPPQHSYAVKLNHLQSRMVCMAMGILRSPDDDWISYRRHCSRLAKSWVESEWQWWSRRWFQRAITWDAHLTRDYAQQCSSDAAKSTHFSWAAVLHSWHGQSWLEIQRPFIFLDLCQPPPSPPVRTRAASTARSMRGGTKVSTLQAVCARAYDIFVSI